MSLESQAVAMETQIQSLIAQLLTLNTQLATLHFALKHEINIATRETIVAMHEAKHRQKKPKLSATNVF
jgi:hypothetical protein